MARQHTCLFCFGNDVCMLAGWWGVCATGTCSALCSIEAAAVADALLAANAGASEGSAAAAAASVGMPATVVISTVEEVEEEGSFPGAENAFLGAIAS
jgi:hypothetical protein